MRRNARRRQRRWFVWASLFFLTLGVYRLFLWPIRFHFPLQGKASWYSRHSPGIRERTANNERFNDQDMTCALWGVPFGQKVRVTNRDTGATIVVRVNDRGPARRYVYEGRVIDLTRAAFRQLAEDQKGLLPVRVELVED